jgi:hypothetical protein
MESMSAPGSAAGTLPPPPPEQKSNRMNANAALIAGVATLVLAIGVGFLIGRSGHEDSGGSQAAAPIKVIEVPSGSDGETAAATPEETTGGSEKTGAAKGTSGGKPANKAAAKTKASDVKEGSQQEEERAKAKTNEVLHTSGDVELETEVEVGGKCKEGAAGCEGEEFTGNFFGE